jgi:fatty acid desaturase
MLEHEDRKEIAKLNYIKTWSSFAVAAIWIGAIGTLVWIISLTLLLLFAVVGHERHFEFVGGYEHRSSASQGNMDDGMQPAPYQSPGSLANG